MVKYKIIDVGDFKRRRETAVATSLKILKISGPKVKKIYEFDLKCFVNIGLMKILLVSFQPKILIYWIEAVRKSVRTRIHMNDQNERYLNNVEKMWKNCFCWNFYILSDKYQYFQGFCCYLYFLLIRLCCT